MVVSGDATAGPRVTARALTQSFDGKAVLHDLDLEVAAGEFVVLIGHSGSGKSTLLRLIAGLDRPSSGRIDVSGEVSLGFQEARLLPWYRVRDNVLFGYRASGDRKAREAVALRALAEVKLEHRADVWPGTLSGGEAQRASLARALVREPDLLLLDEPFGALDALTRLEMQGLVIDLWERHRPSIVLVTHDVGEAVRLADRVLLLDRGRIAYETRIDRSRPRERTDPYLVDIERDLVGRLGVV